MKHRETARDTLKRKTPKILGRLIAPGVAGRHTMFHIVSPYWNLSGTLEMMEGRLSRRVKFTDRSLKAITPPPKPKQLDYFDASLPGFGLRVSYNGRKSWIVLYRCNGVKGRLTLGRFDVLSL